MDSDCTLIKIDVTPNYYKRLNSSAEGSILDNQRKHSGAGARRYLGWSEKPPEPGGFLTPRRRWIV